TRVTIELMRSPSPFAQQVREFDLVLLPCFQVVAFVIPTIVIIGYVWPIVTWFRRGAIPPPGLLVQRRVISAPPVMAAGAAVARAGSGAGSSPRRPPCSGSGAGRPTSPRSTSSLRW